MSVNEQNLLHVVPGLTDQEQAENFKKRLVEAYQPLLALADEVNAAGFEFSISCGQGPLRKNVITLLRMAKSY